MRLLNERTRDRSIVPRSTARVDIDDVIAGYRATGVFRAENWLIVQHDGQDVGVLILADHPQARHWELVYMGLVPEARGCGWGREITQHAQTLAERAQRRANCAGRGCCERAGAANVSHGGFSIVGPS